METTAGEDGSGLGISKFDDLDFSFWRLQIKDYLYNKKLHKPMLGNKL